MKKYLTILSIALFLIIAIVIILKFFNIDLIPLVLAIFGIK